MGAMDEGTAPEAKARFAREPSPQLSPVGRSEERPSLDGLDERGVAPTATQTP
jgi:hypothetical protein